MSDQDESWFDDYNYYRNTGELSEFFEDDEDDEDNECEEEDDGYRDTICNNLLISIPPLTKTDMSKTKLKYLKELTEVDHTVATKYGVELKSFVFRSNDEELTLYMEFASINGKCKRSILDINIVLYDKEGDILETYITDIGGSTFNGFDVVTSTFNDITPSEIGRIFIYFS